MLHVLLICASLAVLATIAVQDMRTLKISNAALAVVTGFAIAVVLTRPDLALGLDAATGFGMLALGLIYWSRGWMGGGDAKLFLPVGLLVGQGGVMVFALGLLGAGTVMYLLVRKREGWAETGVPFAVPVFFAALAGSLAGLATT